MPAFSVIVATYNRSAHIRPTLFSALEQSVRDFEIIVVGDGCTDDTIGVVRAIGSPRISAHELSFNSGSQSAPNNEGIARAKGRYIAYLGHDDVWHPDHLAGIAKAFSRSPAPDVVAAGCVFHGPPDSGIAFVTGLLDDEHRAPEHFLPPSALAHTRELAERIGPWAQPDSVSAPVDCEIMLRAARAGATFASTGQVTVHKFAAGHRYLSYLRPASDEQRAMLSAVRSFGAQELADVFVEAARSQGHYLIMKCDDFGAFGKGHVFRWNGWNKGLRKRPLRELKGRAVLAQTAEPRGVDWHALEHSVRPYRWSGPSPHPRVLIPFRSERIARVALDVLAGTPNDVLDAVSFDHDGRNVPHVVAAAGAHGKRLELELQLSPGDYSVLGITTPHMFCPADRDPGGDVRRLGLALADITIDVRAPSA